MAIAIIYKSKHGTTLKVAELLKEKINDNHIDIIGSRNLKSADLSDYDFIIVGGSIHAGRLQNDLTSLMKKQEDLLLQKNFALYLCCMEDDEKAKQQFTDVFPEIFRKKAICTLLAGGEFIFEKMNMLEKAIIKKISGVDKSVSKLNHKAIDEFADNINRFLRASSQR